MNKYFIKEDSYNNYEIMPFNKVTCIGYEYSQTGTRAIVHSENMRMVFDISTSDKIAEFNFIKTNYLNWLNRDTQYQII